MWFIYVWSVDKAVRRSSSSQRASTLANNWSMEQGAACCVPCDEFWIPHWNMEPAAAWAPLGLPAANTPVVFGSCLQTPVPTISNGGQVVECAAARQNYETEEAALEVVVDHDLDNYNVEMKINGMFEEIAAMFEAHVDMMNKKMHRYPASIKALGYWCTVPRMVAIGPYHHGLEHLEAAKRVKHLAARHCVKESRRTVQEMYDAVVSAAYSCDARRLYDNKDVAAGLFYDDNFLPMMFYDACFLVQFMLSNTQEGSAKMDPLLASLLSSDSDDIFDDIMLLENQIPWQVVEAVMELGTLNLQDFV
ncbi:hypothetical protein BS78_05G265000 [Paspalum vaginatum]|nr:hypothetical protein BS78_05G265000 [Paspalum vaginatum]